VNDLEAAESFYRDVLGCEFYSRVEGRHVFFRCGEGMLLLFQPDACQVPSEGNLPTHGAHGPGHLAFATTADELAAWMSLVESKGVAIESIIDWPQGGRSFYFRDPAGNLIEFAEPRIWGINSR
jgi:catechol 2,3-dioxygenase-like lactoylglutathione lyase family enzyme